MITFWKLYIKSAPFFKFPPKTKRALLILRINHAKPFPTGFKDERRSMETQKFVLTFYPKISNITGAKMANKREMFTFVRTFCVRDQKWTSLLCLFNTLDTGIWSYPYPQIPPKSCNFRSQVSTLTFFVVSLSLIKAKIIVPSMYSFGQINNIFTLPNTRRIIPLFMLQETRV